MNLLMEKFQLMELMFDAISKAGETSLNTILKQFVIAILPFVKIFSGLPKDLIDDKRMGCTSEYSFDDFVDHSMV